MTMMTVSLEEDKVRGLLKEILLSSPRRTEIRR